MTPAQARSLVREARRRLPINDPARGPLLAALVRGSDAELLALAAAHPEPPPPAPVPAPDLVDELERVDPAAAAWLRAARERHAAWRRALAGERAGQGTLDAGPAQGGLWRAA